MQSAHKDLSSKLRPNHPILSDLRWNILENTGLLQTLIAYCMAFVYGYGPLLHHIPINVFHFVSYYFDSATDLGFISLL